MVSTSWRDPRIPRRTSSALIVAFLPHVCVGGLGAVLIFASAHACVPVSACEDIAQLPPHPTISFRRAPRDACSFPVLGRSSPTARGVCRAVLARVSGAEEVPLVSLRNGVAEFELILPKVIYFQCPGRLLSGERNGDRGMGSGQI